MRPGVDQDFGRYRIVSELGRGGMGSVFRAQDTVLHREVALKLLRGDRADDASRPTQKSLARMLREARAAAAINHPNAVAVYDVGDVDGVPYIAMELVEGLTLRVCIGETSVPVAKRLRWMTNVASALAAAHARGVVHRDVKPENIIIRDDGVPKVLDFGIARRVAGAPTDPTAGAPLTLPGTVVGTPAYMAPEQMRGEPLDAAADQFAWGVVTYELLSGVLPWGGGHEHGLRALGEMAWREPTPISARNHSVSKAVDDLVLRALAREKKARFPSMGELITALEAAASVSPESDEPGLSSTMIAAARPAGPVRAETTEAGTHSSPGAAALPPSDGRLPPRIGGKYVTLRCIAKGGMGAVYEVEHAHTGERWALKVLHRGVALDPVAIERFKLEARVSARIKSDHIVRVIDADVAPELDDAPFLVMELLEGRNLEELTAGQAQPPARVVGWLRQVARVLDRAHALGIVHRDLKPENLFLARRLDDSTVVKILDFGVAKVHGLDDGRKTASGTIVGTPHYMAPEQASGDGTIGVTADVWALGMTAFRLLAGREYWQADNLSKLLSLLLFAPIEPPSKLGLDLGEAFDRWFTTSCTRDPAGRFASADAQIKALGAALGVPEGADLVSGETLPGHAVAATPSQAKTPSLAGASSDRAAPRPLRIRRLVFGAIAVVVVGGTITAVAMRTPRRPVAGAALAPPSVVTVSTAAPSAGLDAPPPSAASAVPSSAALAVGASTVVPAAATPPATRAGSRSRGAPPASMPTFSGSVATVVVAPAPTPAPSKAPAPVPVPTVTPYEDPH